MYKNQKTVLLLIVSLVILSVGYFSACKKSNPLTDEEVKTFRTSGYSSPSIETIDPVCTIGSTYEFTAQVPKGFNISKYNIDYFMLTTGATNLAIYTATSAIILIPLTSNWRTINTNPLYISANNDVYFISPSTAKSFISTKKRGMLVSGDVIENCFSGSMNVLSIVLGNYQGSNGLFVTSTYSGALTPALYNNGYISVTSPYVCWIDSSGLCPNNCDYY